MKFDLLLSNSNWKSWYWFWMSFMESRETTAVLTVEKAFTLACSGMLKTWFVPTWHGDRYATDLYILILVWVTLTLIRGHRGAESKNFCIIFLTKFSFDFAESLVYCWDFWSSFSFSAVRLILKVQNPICVILWNKSWTSFSICTFTDFFQTLFDGRDPWTLIWYWFGWPLPSFKVIDVWEIKSLGIIFYTCSIGLYTLTFMYQFVTNSVWC